MTENTITGKEFSIFTVNVLVFNARCTDSRLGTRKKFSPTRFHEACLTDATDQHILRQVITVISPDRMNGTSRINGAAVAPCPKCPHCLLLLANPIYEAD